MTNIFTDIKTRRLADRIYKFTSLVYSKTSGTAQLKNAQLPGIVQKLRNRISGGENAEITKADAYTLASEAAFRIFGKRPSFLQIEIASILDSGCAARIKTSNISDSSDILTSNALAAYLISLSGKGVHVMTKTDMQAVEETQKLRSLYAFLDVTVGTLTADMGKAARKAVYQCDITYGTAEEFALDYLRDNMEYSPESKVQRELSCALVENGDYSFIEQASKQIIISGTARPDISEEQPHLLAEISIRNYLCLYEKLSGTVYMPYESEIQDLYGINTVAVSDISSVVSNAAVKNTKSGRQIYTEFDDVLNDLRLFLYNERDEIMHADNLAERILTDAENSLRDITIEYKKRISIDPDHAGRFLKAVLEKKCGYVLRAEDNPQKITSIVLTTMTDHVKQKMELADGKEFNTALRTICLQQIDRAWSDALEKLNDLYHAVQQQIQAGKNASTDFRADAYLVFSNMLDSIRTNMIKTLCL